MDFIHSTKIPSNEKIIYTSNVCDHCPLQPEKWRTRLLIHGDKLPSYEHAGYPAVNLFECKILFNSVISDESKDTCFMTLDLEDYCLASLIPTPAYMKIFIITQNVHTRR